MCPRYNDKCVKVIERKGAEVLVTRDCLSNLEGFRYQNIINIKLLINCKIKTLSSYRRTMKITQLQDRHSCGQVRRLPSRKQGC